MNRTTHHEDGTRTIYTTDIPDPITENPHGAVITPDPFNRLHMLVVQPNGAAYDVYLDEDGNETWHELRAEGSEPFNWLGRMHR